MAKEKYIMEGCKSVRKVKIKDYPVTQYTSRVLIDVRMLNEDVEVFKDMFENPVKQFNDYRHKKYIRPEHDDNLWRKLKSRVRKWIDPI